MTIYFSARCRGEDIGVGVFGGWPTKSFINSFPTPAFISNRSSLLQ